MGYITEAERYQIEILLKEHYTPKAIASLLGRSLSGIYKEIQRGTVLLLDTELREAPRYCADVAQRKQKEAASHKGIPYKIGSDLPLAQYLEQKIQKEKWSPAATLAYIRKEGLPFRTTLCFKTVYNYIHAGLFLELSSRHLEKRKQHKKTAKKTVALKNLAARSITQRPSEANQREAYGHWEMDTVVGGRGDSHACLLVLSERLTRQERILKLKSRSQKEVIKALDKLEKQLGTRTFRETFQTITMDNGTEFLDIAGIETSCRPKAKQPRTTTYYCHPYCSWERGTNENINRMIRRFIPKGADIGNVTEKEIQWIEHWINNYPRKLFGYRSSNEMLELVKQGR